MISDSGAAHIIELELYPAAISPAICVP